MICGFDVALKLHDDTHTIFIGFVADIGDAFDLFIVHQSGDRLDQAGFCT